MPKHNQTEAAQLVGVSRKTIQRYCKSGKLSFSRDRQGLPQIDTSELMRVFGDLKEPVPTVEESDLALEVKQLRELIEAQTKEIKDLKEQVSQLALPAPVEPVIEAQPAPEPPQSSNEGWQSGIMARLKAKAAQGKLGKS